jgi:hypothetical protein
MTSPILCLPREIKTIILSELKDPQDRGCLYLSCKTLLCHSEDDEFFQSLKQAFERDFWDLQPNLLSEMVRFSEVGEKEMLMYIVRHLELQPPWDVRKYWLRSFFASLNSGNDEVCKMLFYKVENWIGQEIADAAAKVKKSSNLRHWLFQKSFLAGDRMRSLFRISRGQEVLLWTFADPP